MYKKWLKPLFFMGSLMNVIAQPNDRMYTDSPESDVSNLIYITSHGIAATNRVYTLFAPHYYVGYEKVINPIWTIYYPIVSFDYPDSWRAIDEKDHKIYTKIKRFFCKLLRGCYWESCVGQLEDITTLTSIIRKYTSLHNKKAVIYLTRILVATAN